MPHLDAARRLVDNIQTAFIGNREAVEMAVAGLFCNGHILIEDAPGVGKTTLARALAKSISCTFRRIQFTPDLLPSDIIGVSIYQAETQTFRFHPGPVFAQLVLADEINRATPKAQSALLEAMEEQQITSDGETFKLPDPFFVIATQNPHQLIGTFPLPESQLDRFLMRIDMGYPDRDAERALLEGGDRREKLKALRPCLLVGELSALQKQVAQIHCSEALLDYVQDLVDATRHSARFVHCLSPRAGLGLLNSARAWALLLGRDLVLPEDVQAVARSVIGHRLRPASDAEGPPSDRLVAQLLETVPIP